LLEVLKTGVDCRSLAYENESLDCVALDPPYMEGLFRKDTSNLAGGGSHKAVDDLNVVEALQIGRDFVLAVHEISTASNITREISGGA
jgi:hypothetical protein